MIFDICESYNYDIYEIEHDNIAKFFIMLIWFHQEGRLYDFTGTLFKHCKGLPWDCRTEKQNILVSATGACIPLSRKHIMAMGRSLWPEKEQLQSSSFLPEITFGTKLGGYIFYPFQNKYEDYLSPSFCLVGSAIQSVYAFNEFFINLVNE